MSFKQYRRKSVSEMRPVRPEEIKSGYPFDPNLDIKISVSAEDLAAGSPKSGDMIARNPKNHKDQWLVAKAYFEDNLELID